MDAWVYTDGACRNNGRNGPKAAGWATFWGDDHPETRYGPVFGRNPTNNRAELVAILKALEAGIRMCVRHLTVYSDSEYAVKAFNHRIHVWKRSNDFVLFSFRRNRRSFIDIFDAYDRIYSSYENYNGMSKKNLKNAVGQSRDHTRRQGVDWRFLNNLENRDYNFLEFVVIAEVALRWESRDALDYDQYRMFEKTDGRYEITDSFVSAFNKIGNEHPSDMQGCLDKYLSEAGFYQMYDD